MRFSAVQFCRSSEMKLEKEGRYYEGSGNPYIIAEHSWTGTESNRFESI